MAETTGFRKDIQGLRAFAVLAVLFFHLDISLLKGGYLGVDIFFVISGFLITGNILRRYEAGTFTFSQFFASRFKRLMPASVFVILMCLVLSGVFFSPSDQKLVGRSAIHSLFFSANIDFWLQSGYFDPGSLKKPFLHFWSLSVEEQFYFVWPLLIVGLLSNGGRRSLGLVMAALCLISIVGAEILFYEYPSAVFFLMPFRIFEFGVGAMLAIYGIRISGRFFNKVAVVLGLLLMTISVTLMDETFKMPGLLSLVPLIGCSLIIASKGSAADLILTNPICQFVGNISYSVYLVHWPIVVFYKNATGGELSNLVKIAIFILSIFIGYLLFKFVETPFRKDGFWRSKNLLGLGPIVAVGFFFLTICGAVFFWTQTPVGSDEGESLIVLDKKTLRQQTWDNMNQKLNMKSPILLVGDSHSKDFMNVLSFVEEGTFARINIDYKCAPVIGERPAGLVLGPGKNAATKLQVEACANKVESALSSQAAKDATVVILSAYWQEWSLGNIKETILFIQSQTNATVILVGKGVTFKKSVLSHIKSQPGINYLSYDPVFLERRFNSILKKVAQDTGALFLDKYKLQCPENNCSIASSKDGRPFYYDQNHLTISGAMMLAARLSNCDSPACFEIQKSLKNNLKKELEAGTVGEKIVFEGLIPISSLLAANPSEITYLDDAVLLRSFSTKPESSGRIPVASVKIDKDFEEAAAGNWISVSVIARASADNPTGKFAVAYSTNALGNSGWRVFTPTREFETYTFDYFVNSFRPESQSNYDYLGVNADISGLGRGLEIKRIDISLKE